MKKHTIIAGPQGSGKTSKSRELTADFDSTEVGWLDYHHETFFRKIYAFLPDPALGALVVEGYYETKSDRYTWALANMARHGFKTNSRSRVSPRIIITTCDPNSELLKNPEILELFEVVRLPEKTKS